MKAMEEDLGGRLAAVRVDGGAAANNLLMQIQADLLGTRILRPGQLETTGLGAAYLAGLGVGFWTDLSALRLAWRLDREFHPSAEPGTVEALLERWRGAVEKV